MLVGVDFGGTQVKAGIVEGGEVVRSMSAETRPGATVNEVLSTLTNVVLALAPRPAAVLGIPVGFIGAAESKEALAATDLEHLVVHGRRGGAAITAPALHALACEQEIL